MTSTSGFATIAADSDGTIVAWIGQAENWFGHPAVEAMGAPVDLIVPEENRDAHWEGFRRAMGGGERHLEGAAIHLPFRRADGHTVVHPARFHHLTTPAGDLVGVTVVVGPTVEGAAAWDAVE